MKADNPTKLKVPYSTELLRRKRLEIQTLRLEAETLTTQLSELQATRLHNEAAAPAYQCLSTTNTVQWRSAAVVERENGSVQREQTRD
ncbi:hypothetical protein PF003_g35505 [Phytophthora fragariae]|nr:hypothetical protein PF003_g35485 [Phytophthora fragariae]KAE8880454.1 hypothetical protein PF003_g35505 [Phytophthora fragariae]